jgi:hypothetical protein
MLRFAALRQELSSFQNGTLPLKALDRHITELEALGFIGRTSHIRCSSRGVPHAHYRFTDLPWVDPSDLSGRLFPAAPAFMGHTHESQARSVVREAMSHRRAVRKKLKSKDALAP